MQNVTSVWFQLTDVHLYEKEKTAQGHEKDFEAYTNRVMAQKRHMKALSVYFVELLRFLCASSDSRCQSKPWWLL